MSSKVDSFLFVDESGDPGEPFVMDESGKKIPTRTTPFYIISSLCLNDATLFLLEHEMMKTRLSFEYTKEIKSNEISLGLYKELLNILNKFKIKTFYRLIDKQKYKGVFRVDGKRELHNVFDEYNLVKTVSHTIKECELEKIEVVIDRTDRRLLDGKFDSFDNYLKKKVRQCMKEKEIERIVKITHVDSRYVNAMQMSDIICGAIKDDFNNRNTELLKIIDPLLLIRVP